MTIETRPPLYSTAATTQIANLPEWDHFFSHFSAPLTGKEKQMVIDNLTDFIAKQTGSMLQRHIQRIKEIHRKERQG